MSNRTKLKAVKPEPNEKKGVLNTFKESYKESSKEVNNVFYKFLSYPIVLLVSTMLMGIVLFTVLPAINMVGYSSFGGSIEALIVYYPIFIVIDIFVVAISGKVIWFIDKKIIAFSKKITHRKEKKADEQ